MVILSDSGNLDFFASTAMGALTVHLINLIKV